MLHVSILLHWQTVLILNRRPHHDDTPADLSPAFFPHLLTHIYFRPFSIQSMHLNFGLPVFFLPSGLSIHTLFTVLSSGILTIWPANSSRLPFMVVTIFGFAYKIHSSSSVPIPQTFWCVIVPYTRIFLSIFRCHVLRDDFICSVIAHASKSIFFEPIGSFSDLQNM